MIEGLSTAGRFHCPTRFRFRQRRYIATPHPYRRQDPRGIEVSHNWMSCSGKKSTTAETIHNSVFTCNDNIVQCILYKIEFGSIDDCSGKLRIAFRIHSLLPREFLIGITIIEYIHVA
jgi:hypothetical protein